MKKLKNLGRSMSKNEQKKISGGVEGGGALSARCTGTRSYQGDNFCDYHIIWPNGSETDSCDQGCWSGCNTLGSTCNFVS